MSLIDDQSAELNAQLDVARQKCLYGRTYSPAYELARRIKQIRAIMPSELQAVIDPGLDLAEFDRMLRSSKNPETVDPNPVWWIVEPNLESWQRKLIEETASILMLGAITASSKLREVADALDAEEGEDPRQANILQAYEDCITKSHPPTIIEKGKAGGFFVRCSVPTFAELKDAFIKRFGEQCWTTDFGVRKTLKLLGLPLSKSRRGRPVGSRSLIRNRKH